MSARLGVNIDHVATLRQARGESYPSLVEAARECLENGADQITIHLREDRRHIQDPDVGAIKLVTQRYGKPLNLEIATNEEILHIAADTKPEWICIVPEKREEQTTEGGLDLITPDQLLKIKHAIAFLRDKTPESRISLFVESDLTTLEKVVECRVDAVEIHTGDYAKNFLEGEDIESHLKSYENAFEFLQNKSIGFHAGHGLTLESVVPLVKQGLFVEYNIGHAIVCQSIFDGLAKSVVKYKEVLR
jgi:pyridoxine 5-phosphate synthase